VNALLPWAFDSELRATMQRSLGGAPSEHLFGYGPPAGAPHHREAAAAFLRSTGLAEASTERVLLTAGAQHAMAVALLALAEPGDVVLTEAFTYPGIKQLADALRLRLAPVAMDRHGLLPEALRKAARQSRAKFLYTVPTLQNPSSAVLSRARAKELAAAITALGLRVLEDDSYGFLMPEAPRLAPLLPGSIFLTGPSKALAPGVRFGVLHAPLDLVPRLENAIAATANCASPLACELVTDWIRDGTAERVMTWKRQEIAARQRVVAEALAGLAIQTHPLSPHLWLPLPEPWTAHRFVSQAAARGVLVSPAERFAVGNDDTAAVRVCLGPPATRDALRKAMTTLGDLLRQGPGSAQPLA
jgi:DNA-binding transcriptional MocR family regulator